MVTEGRLRLYSDNNTIILAVIVIIFFLFIFPVSGRREFSCKRKNETLLAIRPGQEQCVQLLDKAWPFATEMNL